MDRITISIYEDQHEELDRLVATGEYQSKSEAVRELLSGARQIESLRQRIADLERERRILIEELDDGSGERAVLTDGSLLDRLRWLVFGRPGT